MTRDSPHGLLVLHAVRITGFADTPVIAHRYWLDAATTKEVLRDAEARGWVEHTAFAGSAGWSLTEPGRAENERQLSTELSRVGRGDEVRDVYREFLPLNALLQRACTDWQLRPTAGDRLAVNDHSDPAWDAAVLHELAGIDRALAALADRLGSVLTRFRGYDTRFSIALARAQAGEDAWVDRTEVDSCHRVWFELHEDLIATLGLDRHSTCPPLQTYESRREGLAVMLDLGPAATRMAELLERISDEQLTAPTPCEKTSLGALIDHVRGLSLAFTMAANKAFPPGSSPPPSADASQLGRDWRTRIPAQLAELAAAWRNPDAWAGMTQAGGLDLPGEVAGRVALNELVIHGWDVARASGQAYDCDPESLEVSMAFVTEMSAPGQEASREGLFGPVVDVPADAPMLDRVIGLSGRDPSWTAG